MKTSLFARLAAIAGVSLVLLVALICIAGFVEERRAARDAAVGDIARGSGLAQTVTGPVLALRTAGSTQWLLPERLTVDAALAIEQRRRGIYEARLYRTVVVLRGHFIVPAATADDRPDTPPVDAVHLALGVTDVRGIGTGLGAVVAGAPATFEPGAAVPFLGGGVHASLPATRAVAGAQIDFEITLPLQGTGAFDVVPVGRETQVSLRSPWPHPSFTGDFLPTTRRVDARGFEAHWQTTFFSTNLEELTRACASRADCRSLGAPHLGVSLIDPVDQYVKTERALKYSVLFIALTFAGFLLCEVLKGASVHPMHYGLVGLALALFFLLLLSLAEHVGFAPAYAIAAAACVVLLGSYLRHVLSGARLGYGFAAGLALLYALLYGILAAEDYALLMGSLLLFSVLAAFMLLTRRVDWSTTRED